jgi:hypothetical protein
MGTPKLSSSLPEIGEHDDDLAFPLAIEQSGPTWGHDLRVKRPRFFLTTALLTVAPRFMRSRL